MVIRLENRTSLIKVIKYEFITFNFGFEDIEWKEFIAHYDMDKDKDIVITTYITKYPDGEYREELLRHIYT